MCLCVFDYLRIIPDIKQVIFLDRDRMYKLPLNYLLN